VVGSEVAGDRWTEMAVLMAVLCTCITEYTMNIHNNNNNNNVVYINLLLAGLSIVIVHHTVKLFNYA
jgi:Na+/phosphate symporter